MKSSISFEIYNRIEEMFMSGQLTGYPEKTFRDGTTCYTVELDTTYYVWVDLDDDILLLIT